MKRFFSILLVAILVVTTLSTVAAADEVKPGDTIDIEVTVSGEFANYLIDINASAGLTIKNISDAGAYVINSATSAKANWASSSNVSSHTITVTVEVAEKITCGESLKVTATAQRAAKAVPMEQDNDNVEDGFINTTVTVSGGSVTVNHKWDNGNVTTKPTCTESGVKTYTCENCGNTKTESIPALGHDYKGTVTKAPTCEETGVMTYVCKNDASHTYTETIPALGHDYVGTVTTEPTCTEPGVKTYVCKNDATHTYTEAIPALGHIWCEDFECEHDHEHYDDHYHWYLCLVCGEKKDVEKHVYGEELNGYKFCECGHWIEVEQPGKDDEPLNGDNTLELALGFTAIVAMMATAAYVCKRKFAK